MLSRVANNIYWMARYLERAEHTARVTDVNLVLMLDQAPAYAGRRWERLLRSLHVNLPPEALEHPQHIVQALTFDRNTSQSIMAVLAIARDNARQVRNQLSSEMWEQVNQLYLQVSHLTINDIWDVQTHEFFRNVKEGVQLFHGITDATMRQDEGWHFLRIGRYLERITETLTLLAVYFDEADTEQSVQPRDYLDWVSLLKSLTAFEAYCQVYTADLQPERIAAFLLLNPECPHSVRFAAARVHTALSAMRRLTGARRSDQIERLAGRLHATFDYGQIDEIMADGLPSFLEDVQQQCAQLHRLLHEIYFQPPIEAVLAS